MKKAILTSVAAIALAAPTFAGNLEDPVVESPVAAPAERVIDWTGPYVGIEVGHARAKGFGDKVSTNGAGVLAGYRYDTGTLVLGGELGLAKTQSATSDNGADVPASTGYGVGIHAGLNTGTPFLPYVGVDYSRAESSGVTSDWGTSYNVGVDYQITDTWVVGGQYGYSKEDGVRGDSITVRALMRF